MTGVTVFCFLASYVVALVADAVRLYRRTVTGRAVMLTFGIAGFVAHTAYLLVRSSRTHLPPLLSSTHDWLLVLAWLAVLVYLIVTFVDRHLPIGLFLLPLVLLLVGAAYFVSAQPIPAVGPEAERLRATALRGWAMLHASLLVFGIGGVLLGIVLSMMYLVQHRRLKHQQMMQSGMELPSLARLARWNWWAVILSVPLLTLGMLTGIGLGMSSRKGPGAITFTDPIVVVNGVVWVVMAVFFGWLIGTKRPIARQVALMTLWAFGFLLVTLIGLQVLTGGTAGSLNTWHT